MKNASRQWPRSAMAPPNHPPIATPAICAVEKRATAFECDAAPCACAVSVIADGKKSASAKPMSPRQASSMTADTDAPVSAVMALQATRLLTIRTRLGKRSPRIPATGLQRA